MGDEMKEQDLSPARRRTYTMLNEYLEKHPEATINGAASKLGLNSSLYYQVRKLMGGGTPRGPKARMETLHISEPMSPTEPLPSGGSIVAFVGSINSVIEAVKKFNS